MTKVQQVVQFLQTDVWRIRSSKLPRTHSFWLKQLRIILLALRNFDEDKCQLRASALTFYTLLSVVPMVAMAFGISKGFGLDKMLEKQLYEKMPGQEEVVTRIVEFSHSFLESTKGGLIAGVGIVILFWTVIKVLGNIESSFNDIWGIKKGRSLVRKFSDYLSMMLVCPILFVTSSSVTVMITSQINLLIKKLAFLGTFSSLFLSVLSILPYGVTWVLFTFIYIFMPNTKVYFRSGLMGGIVAGTVYQVVQWIYINFQVGVAKYGAVYGSFAALPLFLAWLQVSWLIVLFGAEVSFAEQNVETYEFEPDCLKASHSFKRLVALRVAQLCVKNFVASQPPWTAKEISHKLEIPIRLLRQVLFELTEAGVLVEVKIADGRDTAFQPGRDIEQLSLSRVIRLLDSRGIADIPMLETEEFKKIALSMEEFFRLIEKSPPDVLLRNI